MSYEQRVKTFFPVWKQIVIHPERFFNHWDQNEDWEVMFRFNKICGVIAAVLATGLSFITFYAQLKVYPTGILLFVFPLAILLSAFVIGLILFPIFRLLGGKGELEQTLKMVGYTQAAISIFSVGIPFFGVAFLIYQIRLLTVGGKIVHGLKTWRSLLAVLAVSVLVSPFLILVLVSTAMMLRS